MAISRIGGASNTAINAQSVTVTLPGSMAVDDLILLAWSCGDDDFTEPTLAMTTSGYTELTTSTLSADGGTTGDGNLAIFYKFHNGSDTEAVTAASGTGNDSSNAVALQVFRGVATVAQGGPLEIAIQTATGTSGGDPNPPQVSGFDESTAVVVIAGAMSTAAAPGMAAPTGYTTNAVIANAATETFRAGVALAYREDPGDPEDPGIFEDVVTGGAWCAATLVLKEAPPPPLENPFPYVGGGYYGG
jgi:type II secretory pathway pseudopilin PulG